MRDEGGKGQRRRDRGAGLCRKAFGLAMLLGGCDPQEPAGPAGEPTDPPEHHALPVVVQGCAEDGYVDRRGPTADRQLAWTLSIGTDPERCMLITVGQTVTWDGNLGVHPLDPAGGDSPNPIAMGGQTGVVTFSAPGTFGFICGVHPSMRGAIRVVAAASVPALGGPGAAILAGLLLLAAGAVVRPAALERPHTRQFGHPPPP